MSFNYKRLILFSILFAIGAAPFIWGANELLPSVVEIASTIEPNPLALIGAGFFLMLIGVSVLLDD